jgi:hypothetical protein
VQDHDRRGARTAGLYLGHRREDGSRRQPGHGGMTGKKATARTKAKTFLRRKKQKLETG